MISAATQQCSQCSKTFRLTEQDLDFCKQFQIDRLELCFECDQKNRLCFRTEWHLYTRRCDFSGKDIISIYPEDAPFPVYASTAWYSDQWDPLSYGRDFDFNRPFFEQYRELQLVVPRLALSNIKSENSDYCNSTYGNKNCYLIFGGDMNEATMYGSLPMRNHSCFDIDYTNDSELCYMMTDCVHCYGCQFSFNSKNCTNCYFISDCSGCTDCILSSNLVNKSYCINNVQYTKVEYEQIKRQLLIGSYQQQQAMLKKFLDHQKRRIVKYVNAISTEASSGDYLKNCQQCSNSFDVSDSDNLRNIVFAVKARDCFNSSMLGDNTELCYNVVSTFATQNTQHAYFVIESSNIMYCEFVMSSHDLFGCISIRNGTYCILNKQYSESQYQQLRERIIAHMKQTGEWGKFFPKQLSNFGYNQSSVNVNYPLTKEQALQQGYHWYDEPVTTAATVIDDLPDLITSTPATILEQSLQCASCHKYFKILPQELEFYQRQLLPLPRQCPTCRYKWRLSLRNPRQLWQRQCMCTQIDHGHAGRCDIEFATTYSPERLELVYCERCYQKEVY